MIICLPFEIEISLIDKFEMIDGITANDVDFRSHSFSIAYEFFSLASARDDFNI